MLVKINQKKKIHDMENKIIRYFPISHHLFVLNKIYIFFIHYSTQIVNKYSNKILFSFFLFQNEKQKEVTIEEQKK